MSSAEPNRPDLRPTSGRSHPANRARRVAAAVAAGSGLAMTGLLALLGSTGSSTVATAPTSSAIVNVPAPTTTAAPLVRSGEDDDGGHPAVHVAPATVSAPAPVVARPAPPAPKAQTATRAS